MQKIDLTADELVRGLLKLSETEHVSILDSCGVSNLGSHLLIAGIGGTRSSARALAGLQKLIEGPVPVIFTMSYDLGAALNGIETRDNNEPHIFATVFETLIVHDYLTGITSMAGNAGKFDALAKMLGPPISDLKLEVSNGHRAVANFTRDDYVDAVETIQEQIRCGDTYQANLTQQMSVENADRPQDVFWRLRRGHPAPFAAFITRENSIVVSASPERFFRIGVDPLLTCGLRTRRIETSPIKGTRRRGATPNEDAALRHDLLASAKDRAENTMIVDLLRNDLGRVCEFGSVRVERLCELEQHPTLFHLVSTVSGELREDATFADVIRALFPCGSITGAPKISTMRIIDELEPTPRGLSMGAIGYSIPAGFDGLDPVIDLSVAIRTMVFRDGMATFNVGGGVTIDSDPEEEYDESLLKAKALLAALNARFESRL